MSIQFHRGFWTVFSGSQAVMAFASYGRALEFVS